MVMSYYHIRCALAFVYDPPRLGVGWFGLPRELLRHPKKCTQHALFAWHARRKLLNNYRTNVVARFFQ